MKKKVLFLCTGNSIRSQMAEAIASARCSAHWQAFSAGIRPADAVHPLVAPVLAEAGIPFKGKPKHPDSLGLKTYDLVITLCDSAKEECPVWLRGGAQVHHDYPDPGLTEGTPEEKRAAFRKLRDSMLADIPYWLEKHDDRKLE
jgi:arsenate reductase (thioredoxin)